MDEVQDESIDSQSGFKLNPIDDGTPLPIAKQVHAAGVPITPAQQVLDEPEGSGTAPYIFGEQVKPVAQKDEAPGFFSTAWHTAVEMSIPHTAWRLGSTLYKDFSDHSEVREGWTPTQETSYFENVPEKYFSSLLSATSDKRQAQIYQDIIQEMKDDAYFSKGPFMGKLAGGLAGFYGSGANFIKVASYARYSTMTETFSRNVIAALPGLSMQAIEMAGVEQLGRAGTDAEEFATSALTMLATSGLLHGVGITYKERMHAKKLHDAKDVIHAQSEDISFTPVLNEKGEVTSYKATANPGRNVSAAQVDAYESFLNTKVNESGLMASKTMQKFFGNRAFGSTVFRMKTSEFVSSSAFLSAIAKNRFLTAGEAKGEASQITASEYHQELQAQGYHLANGIKALYFKSIGLSENNTFLNKMRGAKNAETNVEFISTRDFGIEVRDAIEGNKPSQRAEVNEAAQMIRDFMNDTNISLGKAMGLKDVAFATPKNFFDYFPHAFDHEAIKLDQVEAVIRPDGTQSGSKFIDNIVSHLEEQDVKIQGLISSHDKFNALIQERQNALLENLKSTMRDDKYFSDRTLTGDATEHLEVNPDRAFKEETRALNYEIEQIKKSIAEIEAEKKQWWDSVLEDPENNHLIVDGEMMTKEVRELGSKWLSELSNLDTMVSVLEKTSKKESVAAKKAADKAERNIYRQKDSEGRNKAQEEFREKKYASEWIDAELNKKLSEAREAFQTEQYRLENAARDGVMPRILYRLTADDKIEFINPHRAPELKAHFTSYHERKLFAEQKRDKILGLSQQQVKADLFEKRDSSHAVQAAHLRKRDRTIPYHVYNNGGFFSHDITETITNYADSVGKRLGIMNAFNESPHFNSIEDVVAKLKEEYAEKLANVSKIKDPTQKEKARKKLEKNFEGVKADINGIYNAYHGSDGSQAARGFNKAFGLYANAAFMGGLPISMITDIGQQVMRHGIGHYMATGLIPMIKTMNGHIKSANSRSMAGYAADVGVGMNGLRARVNMSQLNVNGGDSIHMGNWFSRAMQFVGHASGQITLSNYITDAFHTMTAMMAQSRVMRNMHDFVKKGKLELREEQYMASLGIDVKAFAKRFTDQFKTHGRKDGKNGYYSEHQNWTDLEAYDVMKRAIYRDVMSTHFEGTKFDSPLWSQNPFVKPLFTFNNWAFAAFNNITVPTLQGVDGRKAFGIALTMALGMLQEPMRAYINGKEYKAPSTPELAAVGLLNSGIMGQFGTMINLANTAMGGPLPGLLPQKYHDISAAGALAGVPGSIADTIASMTKDFVTGKITKQTIRKPMRLLPLVNSWESRRLTNGIGDQLSDMMGLPENARNASGWSWWESLKNNKD